MTRVSYLRPQELLAWRAVEGKPTWLRLYWLSETDYDIGHVELTESERRIIAVAYLRVEGQRGFKLTQGLHAVEIGLQQDLGARSVYDGITGQPIPKTEDVRPRVGFDSAGQQSHRLEAEPARRWRGNGAPA